MSTTIYFQNFIEAYTSVLVVDERVPMTPIYERFVGNMIRMSLEQYGYDYKNAVNQYPIQV